MTIHTLNQVRSTIIGIGGFGLHAIAHLWPRLHFTDEQRRFRNRNHTPLAKLVSHVVVLPDRRTNTIEIIRPNSQHLLGPNEVKIFWKEVTAFQKRMETGENLEPGENASQMEHCLYNAYIQAEQNAPNAPIVEFINDAFIQYFYRLEGYFVEITKFGYDEIGRISRSGILKTFENYDLRLGTQIQWQLEQAFYDLLQPYEDLTQITAYFIASLSDDVASSIIWPSAQLLKERLSDFEIQLVGLLSVGAYSPPDARLYEEASIYASLTELNQFSQKANLNNHQVPFHSSWLNKRLGTPAFNRCYLMNSTKASQAGVTDEHEVIVAIGNALELFVTANADQTIQQNLAADAFIYSQIGPFSSLGTSSHFLPIHELRDWVKRKFIAEVLEQYILQKDKEAKYSAEQYDAKKRFGISIEKIMATICANSSLKWKRNRPKKSVPKLTLDDSSLHVSLKPEYGHRPLQPSEWYRRLNHHRLKLIQDETYGERLLKMQRLAGTALSITIRRVVSEETEPYYVTNDESMQQVTLIGDNNLAIEHHFAIGIPWRNGYLAYPVAAQEMYVSDVFRTLEEEEAIEPTIQDTVLDKYRDQLIRVTHQHIIRDNKGLYNSSIWLRGIFNALQKEVRRLRVDPSKQNQFVQSWRRKRVDLEQKIGGRPRQPDGRRPIRGIVESRPLAIAIFARVCLLAIFLIFVSLNYFQQNAPDILTTQQIILFICSVILMVGSLGAGLTTYYSFQEKQLKRQAINLNRKWIEHRLNTDVYSIVQLILTQMLEATRSLYKELKFDVNMLEHERDESLRRISPTQEDLDDTPLRKAIFDKELHEQIEREDLKKFHNDISTINLWQWHGKPAFNEVHHILKSYLHLDKSHSNNGINETSNTIQPETSSRHRIWHLLLTSLEQYINSLRPPQIDYKYNIEDYITKSIEQSDDTHAFDPRDYLAQMGYLAKPFIFINEHELTNTPVSIDLLAIEQPKSTYFTDKTISNLRSDARWSTHPPQLLTTGDPFSITYLRTLHGLPIQSLSRWNQYKHSLQRLYFLDRENLVIMPEIAYQIEPSEDGMIWSFLTPILSVKDDEQE